MKLFFKVLLANKAVAYITMENQNCLIKEIAGICNDICCFEDATHCNFTLDISQNVQGAGDTTAGAAAMTPLANSGIIEYYNIQRGVTVYKLIAGQLYLIPYAIAPAVATVPSTKSLVVNGASGDVYEVTHWPYIPEEDTDLIGQSSVANCVVMDISARGVLMQRQRKQMSKDTRKALTAQAIGIPQALAAGSLPQLLQSGNS